ncbi:DUF6867 family protein [Rhizobium sp. SSA_523]|uniref:DUF6867 family protein n=1 Tax=Rhizobium sp. SSA_523 TaxID=2952477 RepID=UPI002090BB1D|nr:hypothetical protein [Rhizobium sp. SSA_523]MCO5732081.1 hypothetical protein [Rhizobium sp. SSA_523]WKC22582.1 hypothetical protein QTJ18_17115 [Rhizobium sp. SSA_523]
MQGLFFETDTGARYVLRFLVLLLGLWTAWRTGRAVAESWKDLPLLAAYVLLLGVLMRFLHYALFQGPFLAPGYYLLDVVLLAVLAYAGFRQRRTRQMVDNYYWLYERTGTFSWKKRN